MKDKKLEEQLFIIGCYSFGMGIIGIFFYFKIFLYYFPVWPCRMYQFFGLYCPGCGGTRSVSALLHGHIIQSILYHPIVPYFAFIYLGFMISHLLEKLKVGKCRGWRFHPWYLYGGIIIIFLNWFIRNYLLIKFGMKL